VKALTLTERLSLVKEKLGTTEKELEAEKARGQQPSLRMQLDHKCKQLQEELGLLESEQRAEKRAELLARMAPLVEELRTDKVSQRDQWDRLQRLCLLAEATERLLGARRRWRRVDHVLCKILDPAWRERKLPRVPTFAHTPAGPVETGSRVNPAREGDEITEYISWRQAARLEKEGKLRIIDEGMPIYDEESVSDPRPPLLDVVKALDFGLPVPDPGTGEILPEFAVAQKAVGFDFRLSFDAASRLEEEARRIKLWEKQRA